MNTSSLAERHLVQRIFFLRVGQRTVLPVLWMPSTAYEHLSKRMNTLSTVSPWLAPQTVVSAAGKSAAQWVAPNVCFHLHYQAPAVTLSSTLLLEAVDAELCLMLDPLHTDTTLCLQALAERGCLLLYLGLTLPLQEERDEEQQDLDKKALAQEFFAGSLVVHLSPHALV